MTPTRLASCALWHPDSPSRLARQKSGRDTQGNSRYRVSCLECQRVRTAEERGSEARKRPYGVYRLTWAPPEMLLGEVA